LEGGGTRGRGGEKASCRYLDLEEQEEEEERRRLVGTSIWRNKRKRRRESVL
jgi:hypothetical protein